MERQMELLADRRQGLRRVPELTEPMRLGLEAIELCGGLALTERRFNRPGSGEPYRVSTWVLRRLIREGLIEVMGLSPATYRITKLGRVARSLGVRS